MPIMRRTAVFRNRHPLIGPMFWALSLQYYLTQIIAAAAWQRPFSLRFNTISDLGNTVCGPYSVRIVCSPLYTYMNASFIVLGLTMMLGSFFLPGEFRRSRLSITGFIAMGLAGFGTLLVGIFPENTVSAMHILGAGLAFVLGNVALVLFSFSLQLPPLFQWYTRLSGIIALVALILFQRHWYLGLGIGGMERVVAYPQSIWLIIFGLYLSFNHFRRRSLHDGVR